jgi:hypothetical protein
LRKFVRVFELPDLFEGSGKAFLSDIQGCIAVPGQTESKIKDFFFPTPYQQVEGFRLTSQNLLDQVFIRHPDKSQFLSFSCRRKKSQKSLKSFGFFSVFSFLTRLAARIS